MTEEELDQILPSKGYEIVPQPENYKPIRNKHDSNVNKQSYQSTPQSYYNVPESAHTYLN